jgi:hypothetical protein
MRLINIEGFIDLCNILEPIKSERFQINCIKYDQPKLADLNSTC